MESKYSIYTSVSTALAVGGTRAAGGGNASGRVATAALLRRGILYWRFENSSTAAFLVEAYSAMFDTEKFICEIELRPAIYNVSNKHIKAKCWNEGFQTGTTSALLWCVVPIPSQRCQRGTAFSTTEAAAVVNEFLSWLWKLRGR